MNLAELTERHPDQKYTRKHWGKDEYVQMDGQRNWTDESGSNIDGMIAATFFAKDWELFEPIQIKDTREPINITKDDISKQVELRDGRIETIIGFDPRLNILCPVIVTNGGQRRVVCRANGDAWLSTDDDIIEILT